ncbi:MAG: AAA family ATPase [Candidatus Roizmanbacteria bacterium]|nr:AAA family ATPase [Candidatus Roizmanbacteria bacterium]
MEHINISSIKKDNYVKLSELELLILVGITGVGKTTTLQNLSSRVAVSFLPNRRELTDRFIIPHMQKLLNLPIQPVQDRAERFNITGEFRKRFKGGMAYVLNSLYVSESKNILIFDGLRGINEVEYAQKHLPRAKYLFLEAPDSIRIERLCDRDDTFDEIKVSSQEIEKMLKTVIGSKSAQDLLKKVENKLLKKEYLIKAIEIVKKEKEHYDPDKTKKYLLENCNNETLVINTHINNPDQVIDKVLIFL